MLSPGSVAAATVFFPQRVPSESPPCCAAFLGACGCHLTPPVASPHGPGRRRAHTLTPVKTVLELTNGKDMSSSLARKTIQGVTLCFTSEMTTGRCSIGCPGTSPRCSWCLNPCLEILFTRLLSTHNSLVRHGGDVFPGAKTVGMLSTALKAPEISSDLFQKFAC